MLTGRSIWINGSFSPVQHAIVSDQAINDRGVTTQRYVNTNGNYTYWFYGSYGFKLKKSEIQVSLNANLNGSRYVNFVRYATTSRSKNKSEQTQAGLGLFAGKFKDEKYEVSVNVNFNYNYQVSSITVRKTQFWSQEHNFRFSYFITKRWTVGSNANFYLREKTASFPANNNFTVWDAELSYKIFKKRNASLRFEVKDILRQRRGFDRTFSENYVYERNYNMLGRYAMLSFVWNFTKNPGETK
jgi:hypothetical protein